VSTPYLWNGSTYVATPYGGGATLPNAIVFGTSPSTGRTAVLGDFVGGAAPAIWNGAPCTVGTNVLQVNGQCGPGGGSGSIIASPQFQLGDFPSVGSTTTIQGAGATTDAAGNVKTKSYDGLNTAFGNQTAPGANNGIATALATAGTFLTVGPDYPNVEGIYGNGLCPNYRIAIGCPPPFANDTVLTDYRTPYYGSYAYNTNMGPQGGFWRFDRWVSNEQPQAVGDGNLVTPLSDGL
jgi:hypothetical protein